MCLCAFLRDRLHVNHSIDLLWLLFFRSPFACNPITPHLVRIIPSLLFSLNSGIACTRKRQGHAISSLSRHAIQRQKFSPDNVSSFALVQQV